MILDRDTLLDLIGELLFCAENDVDASAPLIERARKALSALRLECPYVTVWTDPKDCWHTVRQYGAHKPQEAVTYWEVHGKGKIRIGADRLTQLMGLIPDSTCSARGFHAWPVVPYQTSATESIKSVVDAMIETVCAKRGFHVVGRATVSATAGMIPPDIDLVCSDCGLEAWDSTFSAPSLDTVVGRKFRKSAEGLVNWI